MKRLLPLLILLVPRPASTQEAVGAFLETHCFECHDGEVKKGGLDLTALRFDLADANALAAWVRVHDRVRDGEMPPPKVKDRPAEEETETFAKSLGGGITAVLSERQQLNGRVVARRLTRLEYERAMHELLGVRTPLAALLPEDPKTGGFDRVADGQPLSPVLLERYLDAGRAALDEALGLIGDKQVAEQNKVFGLPELVKESPWFYGGPPDRRDGYAAVWNYSVGSSGGGKFYGRLPATTRKQSGWQRVTVRARALHPSAGHVWAALHRGPCDSKAPQLTWIGWLDLTEETRDFAFQTWIEEGEMLHLRPMDDTTAWRGRKRVGDRLVLANDEPPEAMRIPGVAIERIEIRSLRGGLEAAEVGRRIFGADRREPGSLAEIGAALQHLAAQAWRRPSKAEEVEPALALAKATLDSGKTPLAAWREGALAVLTSPRFLFFQEEAGNLDDYALAARLSAMLWSLPPDAMLRQVAADGALRSDEELRRQTDRLLDDPRTAQFVADFTEQWLKLDEIDFTVPDEVLYPEYDEMLKHSMLGETRAFFRDLLAHDLPVRTLAAADFAMLNGRLAAHYGLNGPSGLEFQRVALPADSVRGGLLGQAAVLKVTANGTTTSPVLRGVWVLERLLSRHIPLPPPNVGSVEPDIRGARTIREQLNKHRHAASCAACHQHIDPPGFALENFDPIGGWRERYRAVAGEEKRAKWVEAATVDASGTLPGGKPFRDIREFRAILAKDETQLARALVSKLVAYGTGAPVSFADRAEVEAILAHAAASGYGVRTLLHEVVQSPLFRHK